MVSSSQILFSTGQHDVTCTWDHIAALLAIFQNVAIILLMNPIPPILQRENVSHYFSGTACCFHPKCPVSFLLCLTPLMRTWPAWVPSLVPLSCYSLFQRVSVILTLKTFKAHLTPTMVLILCAVPCPCNLLFCSSSSVLQDFQAATCSAYRFSTTVAKA